MLSNNIVVMEEDLMIRTYSELCKLKSFEDRYNYLRLHGQDCKETFGFDRYLNQIIYKLPEWKSVRDKVIVRDCGCDLGIEGHEIGEKILVHHMNPITMDDIINHNQDIFNPEYLICVSHQTHNAIHYGDESQLILDPIERSPNDTCPWKG